MPDRAYTDRELLARARQLNEAIVRAQETEQGVQLPQHVFRTRLGQRTIAVTEALVRGQYLYVISATDSAGYRYLRRNANWLRPFEVIGGPNVNIYPKPTLEEAEAAQRAGKPIPDRVAMHAEQIGVGYARSLGGIPERVAASWNICDPCRSFFRQFGRNVRLIDPSTPTPPATPSQPSRGTSYTRPPQPLGGPSNFSRGQRAAAGLLLVIQGANFLLERYVTAREEARVRQALRARDPYLEQFRAENPTVGVMIYIFFDGEIFEAVEFSYGLTEREAQNTFVSTRLIARASTIWIPPLRNASITSYRPPFSRVALATFSGEAVFQNVEFMAAGGFNDDGESTLLLALDRVVLRFWILRTPHDVTFYYGGRWDSKEVDTVSRRLASGELVECVDLDPTVLSRGSSSALMVFPADEATAEYFARIGVTSDRFHTLRQYDLTRVRWISPERTRMLGRTR